MFVAYVFVTVIAAAANIYAAANDFIRPQWLLVNMTRLGVPESWLSKLGLVKAAGAMGLFAGFVVPVIGTTSAIGLTLFFVAAIVTHLRAHDRSFGVAVVFLLLAVASLLLGLHARGPAAMDLSIPT